MGNRRLTIGASLKENFRFMVTTPMDNGARLIDVEGDEWLCLLLFEVLRRCVDTSCSTLCSTCPCLYGSANTIVKIREVPEVGPRRYKRCGGGLIDSGSQCAHICSNDPHLLSVYTWKIDTQ